MTPEAGPPPACVGIVGGTPAGIAAALTVAELGGRAIILSRETHLGGLPANGLGATDIGTRGATTGVFQRFVEAIDRHYAETYGPDSIERRMGSGGHHFEPSVAARVFQDFLTAAGPAITVLRERTFHALPEHVRKSGDAIKAVQVTHNPTLTNEWHEADVWIDATYEGDLAAAAGVPYRLGREGFEEFREPMAGKIYRQWGHPTGPGSTGEGDERIQAYNYRLCLTDRTAHQIPFTRPENYDRSEYTSLIDDYNAGRNAGIIRNEIAYAGVGFLTNMVRLPRGKTDANNQHLALVSTDLPVENNPWPTADWAWRDAFAVRLREYTEGLFYFAATDPAVPTMLQRDVRRWGWAADEYTDNGGFPRQVYVREARRIHGHYTFTAHDALPLDPGGRPPVHRDSITASHYALDSHATRKRETGRGTLEGFFSYPTRPYTVPYRVMVPATGKGLLVPVAASATHVGLSTLRMEPCWMAMGEAAGAAAVLAFRAAKDVAEVDIDSLQRTLLSRGATLIHRKGDSPRADGFAARQLALLHQGLYAHSDG